ncbi:FAD-dependent oxidoreductase [Streptomyces sp. TRM70308]|uniref:flavin monoamine oxidase family protein n=1 Tax=Streptomyces sp. TRM70308 TaxID=3131932 RepID=UPI003D00B067
MPPSQITADVAVVGAGLCGLRTATLLQQAGRTVTVLEAAETIGGRTPTTRLGTQHHDLGGELVGRDYHATRRLLHELGLHLTPVPRLTWVTLLPHTRPLRNLPHLPPFLRALRRLSAAARQLPAERPWEHLSATRWDAVTVSDWLDHQHVHGSPRRLLTTLIRTFAAADPGEMSLLHLLYWVRTAPGLFTTLSRETRWRIAQGADSPARALADQLTQPVQVHSHVTRIEQDDRGVTLTTAGRRTHRARHALVCLPLPATATLGFTPPLPPAHRRLLDEARSGHLTKIVATLTRHQGRHHRRVALGEGILTLALRDGARAEGFAPGPYARLPEAELAAELRGLLDLSPADVQDTAVRRWATDPLAGGAYPVFRPGQLVTHGPQLRASHGRVHFAGADRSTWPGTIEGAVRDAQRAAASLLSRTGASS